MHARLNGRTRAGGTLTASASPPNHTILLATATAAATGTGTGTGAVGSKAATSYRLLTSPE